MNNQEIFTAVKNHLLTQMQKSMDNTDTNCVYHSPTGLKCALGIFLTPEEATLYNTLSLSGAMLYYKENPRAISLVDLFTSKGITDLELASQLQSIHDIANINEWESDLENLAKKYGLNYNE